MMMFLVHFLVHTVLLLGPLGFRVLGFGVVVLSSLFCPSVTRSTDSSFVASP